VGSAAARDYRVSEIRPLGEVKCNFHNESSPSSQTKPCSDFKAPAKVAVGEPFSAEGLRRVIRVVVASQLEKDSVRRDSPTDEGQWSCVAAETPDDLGEGQPHRVWLLIPRCVPVL
jgi:hypothetical protein